MNPKEEIGAGTDLPVDDSALSFEQALAKLEQLAQELESGRVPLEQSVVLLRRAIALADRCEAALQQAEGALEELLTDASGQLIKQKLDPASLRTRDQGPGGDAAAVNAVEDDS